MIANIETKNIFSSMVILNYAQRSSIRKVGQL